MSVLLLIPGLISLFLVLRGRIETAFLSVYLPALILLPETYSLRIPHTPPTSAAEYALIPIGLAAVGRLLRSGSYAAMDLLVVLFAASVSISEIIHSPILNDGIFSAFDAFVSLVLAYMVGRQLIEPNLRLITARRFVVLMLLLGPPGLYEWRMGQNLYGIVGERVLGISTVNQSVQLRGGHGRLSGAFSAGEIAGIAFGMALCLNAWLSYLKRNKAPIDLGSTFTKLQKYRVPALLLLLYLWLTQSRGPQLAFGAALLILQIPRFKNTKLMSAVVAILLIGGSIAAYAYFAAYTNVADPSAVSEQQGSALYRRNMNLMYAPIAEAGGWTGWGLGGIPHIPGFESIDNHFLLVHLAWGKLAYYLFVLISFENIRVLLVKSWRYKSFEDRAFIFSMMGAMAVLWITLLTVYMGEQLPQVAFLLIGWTQAIMPVKPSMSLARQGADIPIQKFAFRRVFG